MVIHKIIHVFLKLPVYKMEMIMADEHDYWTQKRPDGRWESKREGAKRASKVTDTQVEAWAFSKNQARDNKGEAYLKNEQGKIRERNTYGNDPRKTKG